MVIEASARACYQAQIEDKHRVGLDHVEAILAQMVSVLVVYYQHWQFGKFVYTFRCWTFHKSGVFLFLVASKANIFLIFDSETSMQPEILLPIYMVAYANELYRV